MENAFLHLPGFSSYPGACYDRYTHLVTDKATEFGVPRLVCFRATPLHYAAMSGNIDAAQLLLEAGAQINLADHHGTLAIHHAACIRCDTTSCI
eukprot:59551-Prorocentrum_minimum.AAC.6